MSLLADIVLALLDSCSFSLNWESCDKDVVISPKNCDEPFAPCRIQLEDNDWIRSLRFHLDATLQYYSEYTYMK